jgi:hypothetical protein
MTKTLLAVRLTISHTSGAEVLGVHSANDLSRFIDLRRATRG